jgi:hypothetical protein
MAPYTVGVILLIYHDHLRQCVTADIHFIADNASCQAWDCAGRKRSAPGIRTVGSEDNSVAPITSGHPCVRGTAIPVWQRLANSVPPNTPTRRRACPLPRSFYARPLCSR